MIGWSQGDRIVFCFEMTFSLGDGQQNLFRMRGCVDFSVVISEMNDNFRAADECDLWWTGFGANLCDRRTELHSRMAGIKLNIGRSGHGIDAGLPCLQGRKTGLRLSRSSREDKRIVRTTSRP